MTPIPKSSRGRVVPGRIETFIADSLEIKTPGELQRYFLRFMAAYGFGVAAYAVLVKRFRRLDPKAGLVTGNFPRELVGRYFREDWHKIDPFAEAALLRNSPFRWFEVEEARDLTPEQRKIFETLRGAGFVDGVAAPVFGRYGDIACFLLSHPERRFDLATTEMCEIQLVCQLMHARHSDLPTEEERPKLSPREKEVARWIALGKSNAAIAEILGVSTNTIDTIVRRYFLKLGVNTRVEAALKSVSLRLAYI